MSRLAQRVRGGKSATASSGVLTGSGSLSIPQGVYLVSLTGRGANGSNNYWYDPGQAYIAPSGYNAGRPYIAYKAAVYSASLVSEAFSGYSYSGAGMNPYGYTTRHTPSPVVAGTQYTYFSQWDSGAAKWWNYKTTWNGVLVSAAVAGQSYIAPYYTNPGQSYIAPSSGGGPLTGASTTATLNSVTGTWIGGYDTGGVGTTSSKDLISSGAGQSMSYSIPSTGALAYYYEY